MDEHKERMKEVGWVVKLDFESVKWIFEPVIERILQLVREQLDTIRSCKTIFLVGDFS
jgi:hypothetical protein